ncbi:hypothetical protein BO99DRAFT_413405 [Aspergillus violaceofuscus CBS 115571]|uniref:Uncharacterized protein n=1 Tax=Aspergillus violaceofuscus (strain CBS 115571) TaxID=1450538 RepID=A0A2V5H4L1_ASPV1|nr:hypothetical protein BO99DRAFT_413405 [Aspergillus violaceofuscus CBS 115571]
MPTNAKHVRSRSLQQGKGKRKGKRQAPSIPDPTLWDDYYKVTTHGEVTQDGAHRVSCQVQCRYCWMSWTSSSSLPSATNLQLHLHFCPGRKERLADAQKRMLGKCPGHLPKDPTSSSKQEEWHYDGEHCQPPELTKLTTEQMRERFVIGTKGFQLKAQCRDCDRKVCNTRWSLCAHLARCAMRRKFLLFRDEKADRWAKCRDCGAVVKATRGAKMVHSVKECPVRASD